MFSVENQSISFGRHLLCLFLPLGACRLIRKTSRKRLIVEEESIASTLPRRNGILSRVLSQAISLVTVNPGFGPSAPFFPLLFVRFLRCFCYQLCSSRPLGRQPQSAVSGGNTSFLSLGSLELGCA